MAMRNFWIEANIDGRKTKLMGGPRSKTGGLRLQIRMRDSGQSILACKAVCTECGGDLIIMLYDKDGKLIYRNTTER